MPVRTSGTEKRQGPGHNAPLKSVANKYNVWNDLQIRQHLIYDEALT